jgi:hypothetical protein
MGLKYRKAAKAQQNNNNNENNLRHKIYPYSDLSVHFGGSQ